MSCKDAVVKERWEEGFGLTLSRSICTRACSSLILAPLVASRRANSFSCSSSWALSIEICRVTRPRKEETDELLGYLKPGVPFEA